MVRLLSVDNAAVTQNCEVTGVQRLGRGETLRNTVQMGGKVHQFEGCVGEVTAMLCPSSGEIERGEPVVGPRRWFGESAVTFMDNAVRLVDKNVTYKLPNLEAARSV